MARVSPKLLPKKKIKKRASKTVDYELFDWRAHGPHPVIGVDEVGRGCLAGPVYACAAILPIEFDLFGVTDSKLLSEARRETFDGEIRSRARVSVGIADENEIAEWNILRASLLAMKRAVEGLGVRGECAVIIDGNQLIPGLGKRYRQTALVKGDLRATPISAASIVAKVARDRLMRQIAMIYPEYGFDSNKGYACERHVSAVAEHGPCARHRREFAGVREHWHRVRPEEANLGGRLSGEESFAGV